MRNFFRELGGPQFFVLALFASIIYFALYNPSANDRIEKEGEELDRERIVVIEKAKKKNPAYKKAIEIMDWSRYVEPLVSTESITRKIERDQQIRKMYYDE